MLTSLDIKKLQSVFVTKDDLKEELKVFVTKEEMISGFDAVMHELRAIREDQLVGTYRRSENLKKIADHENRISFVEGSLAF